jgi:predicted GTPase
VTTRRIAILGAAGRDFHDFLRVLRDDPDAEVVAFTAAQIPGIDSRRFPASLAGDRYPEGIPIVPEDELERLARDRRVDEVVLSYSDLSHASVMHLASRALAAGAGFRMLSPRATMLRARVPVIAVCAVRTGCGKSQVARAVVRQLRARGKRPVVLRHPMPYGDLDAQAVQRFASLEDLDGATIEEREDYEPHLEMGTVVFSGVDYERVLAVAEPECDVIVWDGGNNDLPFLVPDLWITVLDPHRAGHELGYHPGEANFRAADVLVVNKSDTATPESLAALREAIARVRPDAEVSWARSEIAIDRDDLVRDRRVLVIEDGPTITHGEMPFGAGFVAAQRAGAAAFVDPRPYAVGSIREVFARWPHVGLVLPAVGYSPEQLEDLEATIAAVPCDAIVCATPADLRRAIRFPQPCARVRYELGADAADALARAVDRLARGELRRAA